MSMNKGKTIGNWALPPTNNNNAGRSLAGRVIFGMLTGHEGPEPTREVITSAKKEPRR
jgi:hypothetical protein